MIDSDSNHRTISRRKALSIGVVGVAGGSVGAITALTRTATAVSVDNDWAIESDTYQSEGGTIDSIQLGGEQSDATGGLIEFSWEGFNDNRNVLFTIDVRGNSDDFTDDAKTTYENLLQNTYEVTNNSGTANLEWGDIFDDVNLPADILDHTALDASDFEATTDGETRTRELDVRLTADVQDESATSQTTDTIDVTVENTS